MLDIIRKIDAFPKAYDDFRVKTSTGAICKSTLLKACFLTYILIMNDEFLVSVISIIVMAILFTSELNRFMKPVSATLSRTLVLS
jgi:hypothetical protein